MHELVGKQGFPKNKMASKLIKKKAEEIDRYKNFDDLKAELSEIKTKCDEFKMKIETDRGIDQIQEQCVKLKNQVHLRTDVLIEQVNQINESMIAEINEYEKDCIQSFSDKIGEFRKDCDVLVTELDDFYDIKSKYVTQFKIDEKVVKESLADTFALKRKLSNECNKLEKIKFNNRIIDFTKSSFQFEEKFFGSLSKIRLLFEGIKFDGIEQNTKFHLFDHDGCGRKVLFYEDENENFQVDLIDPRGERVKQTINIMKTTDLLVVCKSSRNYVINAYISEFPASIFGHYLPTCDDHGQILIIIDSQFNYVKHKFFDLNFVRTGCNDSNIICLDDSDDFYYLDMNLEFVDNKPFDKITDNFETNTILMSRSHLFTLCSREILRIFDLNTLDLVKKIDVKADEIKLVSTSHLIIFDSGKRMIHLYNQSGDFEKLDQVDLSDELESGEVSCISTDTSPIISLYGFSCAKSVCFDQLFNIHVQ
jgi:hypothetical protein